jgi:hypothetical protein
LPFAGEAEAGFVRGLETLGFQSLLNGQVGDGGLGGLGADQDSDAQQNGGGEFHAAILAQTTYLETTFRHSYPCANAWRPVSSRHNSLDARHGRSLFVDGVGVVDGSLSPMQRGRLHFRVHGSEH